MHVAASAPCLLKVRAVTEDGRQRYGLLHTDLAVLEMIQLPYPPRRAGLRNVHMIKSFEVSMLRRDIAMLL